jgi:hypothetical protein
MSWDDPIFRAEYKKAMRLAGSKVPKKPKVETDLEKFERISEETEVKRVKKAKSMARTAIRKKQQHRLTTFFKKT